MLVAVDGQAAGVVAAADTIRPTAAQAHRGAARSWASSR